MPGGVVAVQMKRFQSYHASWIEDLGRLWKRLPFGFRSVPCFWWAIPSGKSVRELSGPESLPGAENGAGAYLVSAPIALDRAIGTLDRGWNKLYTTKFLGSLGKRCWARLSASPEFRWRALRAAVAGTVRNFDEIWTAPVHGFKNAEDYYIRSSSATVLPEIQVPVVFLNAQDDPVVPWRAVEGDWLDSNPHVRLVWTREGGHVGFVDQSQPRWLEERILQQLQEWSGEPANPVSNGRDG